MRQDSKRPLTENEMCKRVAMEVKDGYCVNLGAGMPFPVANYISRDIWSMVHIEHGVLGVGTVATDAQKDRDLMGLGRRPLSLIPGAACFSSVEAFTMLRGGHIDLSVLGTFEVSEKGDIANWLLPGDCPIIGGAMDITGHAKRLIAMLTHTTKKGKPKVLKECLLPVTARGVVNMIVTDLAVMDVTPAGLVLTETAPGYTPEEIQALTEATFTVSGDLKEIPFA
ncbi:MAG: succinyl-CoA--3-ketoacid-CoA transferase [Deltaproteobacteria bacterium]|nr:succinyl-CoA--3-ketoacid-CoA transferase [Deltaproteobacteria bacterium]